MMLTRRRTVFQNKHYQPVVYCKSRAGLALLGGIVNMFLPGYYAMLVT